MGVHSAVDVVGQIGWARGVAHAVAMSCGFPCGEAFEELAGEAMLILCQRAKAFDPGRVPPGGDLIGAFRGFARPRIVHGCRQHALRLRNGGTYHLRGHYTRAQPVPVFHLAGDSASLIDPTSDADADGDAGGWD